MDRTTRNAAVAAAIILIGFGFVAFWLPNIMLAVGNQSPLAAALVAVIFVGAFFMVFWLRGRSRGGE